MIDYKTIIKNRSLRLRILQMLCFLPDLLMIKLQYRIKTGRKLNLKKPRRFTEKLQWYKLYYRNREMIRCVDKYEVRNYVKEKGLEEILVPCVGVFESAEEINWKKLPERFVMKDTLGSGGNSVIVVMDKSKADFAQLTKSADEWSHMNARCRSGGREWPYYSGKKHRILIEAYLDSNPEQGGLLDYKFFCFSGRVEYLYLIADRIVGESAALGIYDRKFHRLAAARCDERVLDRQIPKPDRYEEMVRVAEKLAKPFPEVRIDLYYQNECILFGEMTFWDGSGYMSFEPDSFDFEMGRKFELPEKLRRR